VRAPERLALAHAAHIAQALGHHAAGGGGDVDPDPLALELLRGDERGAAAAEGVEDDVVFVGADFEDAFEQRQRLLRWIAKALRGLALERANVIPNTAEWNAGISSR
jgi:hypothetical protein